jgi:hypothetical protein
MNSANAWSESSAWLTIEPGFSWSPSPPPFTTFVWSRQSRVPDEGKSSTQYFSSNIGSKIDTKLLRA